MNFTERKQKIVDELELLDTSELDTQEQQLRIQLDAVLNERNQILNQKKPLEEELTFILKVEDYIESLKKEEQID